MKLSDYVIKKLERFGVCDVFLLAGGGIMHLLNSVAQSKTIHKYYTLHEQGAGFAADGYAQCSNKMGVVFATTGPGATNVVTPLASAYIDSTPLLVISGQVKTSDITSIPGVRQTGAQEVGIIEIVKTITKYAVTVTKPETIGFELEKAFYLANHGRPGPVWIDIPLDVQAADINPDNMQLFMPDLHEKTTSSSVLNEGTHTIYEMLRSAQRPCILAGSGVFLSGAMTDFRKLIACLKIPALTSQRVHRIFHDNDNRYYYGNVGRIAPRYGNYILQNSDFLLSIGSGLRYYLTVFDEEHFAFNAKKAVVNVSAAEIEKLRMPVDASVVCDAKLFIDELLKCYKAADNKTFSMKPEWLAYCDRMRAKYPVENEPLPHDDGMTDGYQTAWAIKKYSREDDVFLASPSAFCYTYNLELKGTQDYVCPMGLGSMGTALPAAIGACVAAKGRRVIVGEGDGSLQHNIQELALLKKYHLPIKLFVDTNGGYRQIYTMQTAHFKGRLAGCTPESGIEFPDLQKIASAYDLAYLRIERAEDTESVVKQALSNEEPMVIEVVSNLKTEFVPNIKSRMDNDGRMLTAHLEDMYPFLPKAEHTENMKISMQ